MKRSARGFTLVEVLVALLLMALLTGLSWQAMDGMLRAREHSRGIIDRTARLGTVLAQWQQDLQSVHDAEVLPQPLMFDGQTLRLTRRVEGGVALVVWAVRSRADGGGEAGGVWQRWASPPCTLVAELQQAWLQSQQFMGNEPGQVMLADGAGPWQLYYNYGGNWANAQSSGNPGQQPDAVRLQITLDGQVLLRDIALQPSS